MKRGLGSLQKMEDDTETATVYELVQVKIIIIIVGGVRQGRGNGGVEQRGEKEQGGLV